MQIDIHALRIGQIAAEVAAKSYIWDAYDQGRYAAHLSDGKRHNPHLIGHVNHLDWRRGLDDERRYCARLETLALEIA